MDDFTGNHWSIGSLASTVVSRKGRLPWLEPQAGAWLCTTAAYSPGCFSIPLAGCVHGSGPKRRQSWQQAVLCCCCRSEQESFQPTVMRSLEAGISIGSVRRGKTQGRATYFNRAEQSGELAQGDDKIIEDIIDAIVSRNHCTFPAKNRDKIIRHDKGQCCEDWPQQHTWSLSQLSEWWFLPDFCQRQMTEQLLLGPRQVRRVLCPALQLGHGWKFHQAQPLSGSKPTAK